MNLCVWPPVPTHPTTHASTGWAVTVTLSHAPATPALLLAAVAFAANAHFHAQVLDGCSVSVWLGGSLLLLLTVGAVLGHVLSRVEATTRGKLKRH
jgi:hypothetical protein